MPEERRAPRLGDVQETLLIPLYGRAVETRKRRGMIDDPRAVEMVEAIDYDFAKWDGARSLPGSTLRTLLFDAWVAAFLRRHPGGTVVEVGTGLNTRFDRLDNGTVHWFDLDLPDVIALRREFFQDTDRRRMIAASVTDPSWLEDVRASAPGPYFIASEAVLLYLPQEEVRGVFEAVAERLPGAWLAAETASAHMIDTQDGHDVLAAMAARMRWRCDDPAEVTSWAPVELRESRTFASLPPAVRARLPLHYRLMVRAMAVLQRKDAESYRFNLFRFSG
ncbi:class I SAM-dependent methyltransferase [Streptomyces sp. NPDC046887]|uniref:class I SAM-dependent methyltransferase n=1 Tax=Streptomyces sp. NPDC046887 TaxID=3155472 RepID=UPI0033C2F1F0